MSSFQLWHIPLNEKDYSTNGLRFPTSEQANQWARELNERWKLWESWEVRETDKPANCEMREDGTLRFINE
jgi:hypothetical protein